MTKEQRLQEIFESIDRPFLSHPWYPREVFFFRGNDFLFSYDGEEQVLRCSNPEVWCIFEQEYGMGFKEIYLFIEGQARSLLKLRRVIPLPNWRETLEREASPLQLRDVTSKK